MKNIIYYLFLFAFYMSFAKDISINKRMSNRFAPITFYDFSREFNSKCLDSNTANNTNTRVISTVMCQDIVATINSTAPLKNTSGIIEILTGETINFTGSATFSVDASNATFVWIFGDGNTATGTSASNLYSTPGTYTAMFTASDNDPIGCSDSAEITIIVLDSTVITINNSAYPQSSFSPNALVKNVLITGECAQVDNISFQVNGAATDLTTKSYGYFTKGAASNFPFEQGIVLTNGRAFPAGNSFVSPSDGRIDFINSQPGDSDLEAALSQNNTNDANFIKFNFTPTSDRISFRYLMASEEYDGSTECMFADSFAFLLREVGTTSYTNLAVLADDTPVSVTNINNAPMCTANADFFEGYNLGNTNYDGRTKVLIASASVNPNTVYEIKLVLADQGDSQWDSAIFLEAGSFNLGGNLGPDYIISSGTAVCDGETIILDTGADSLAHKWFFNGVEQIGETKATLPVTVAGEYAVEVTLSATCKSTDTIIVEFFNNPIANPIADQTICDTNNDGLWAFNLMNLEVLVLGTQPASNFEVTFHNSQSNANTNMDALTSPYTNQLAYQEETIYVRIENAGNTSCFDTTSFKIDVFNQATPTAFTYALCDNAIDTDDTNGFVTFNLPAIDSEVLNTQDPLLFTVSYHLDQAKADANIDPLPDLYTNTIAGSTQIVARVENNDNTACFATVLVDLVVNKLPTVTNYSLIQCDIDTDGIANFNLTEANTFLSTNAVNETFTYYNNTADALVPLNAIPNFLAYPNTNKTSNPDVLFARIENNITGCFRLAQLDLFVSTTKIPTSVVIDYTKCDTDAVNENIMDGITTFDFSNAEALIRAESGLPTGQNLSFSYYETEANAEAETNAIPDISNHRNTNSPYTQDIFVRIDGDIDNTCIGLGRHIRLRTINPTPNRDPLPIILCDDITVGDLIEPFDLTQRESYIFNGDPNVSATYFSTYETAFKGTTGVITNPSTYKNTAPSETLFIRITNPTTSCFAIVELNIQVNTLPDDSALISDFFECENNTDFSFNFNLDSKTSMVLNGQDPALFNVTYHKSQANADSLIDPLPSPYTNSSNPQLIYVAITNINTGCSISTQSFNLEINEGAEANSDGNTIRYELCDNLGDNDGFAQFNLTTQNTKILDGQDPMAFTVSYHESLNAAELSQPTLPTLYKNQTVNSQTLYARVSNNIRPNACYAITELTLKVNLLPIFNLEDNYILCLTTNGSETVDTPLIIDTGLSISDYRFEWFLNGASITSETGPSLSPTVGGTYSVIVTDTSSSIVSMCSNFDFTEVIESGIPDEFTVNLTSQAFSGNNIISALASGNSIYEYRLDNESWQDTGDFENVTGGEHLISSRDINGCGVSTKSIFVIDYPKYLTPNGDGIHDQWNIKGINLQPNAIIYIFDRYGKLLKQLNPLSAGWDGTYNGNSMPTGDYWFSLQYVEPLTNQTKTFKAHFTLKR